MTVIRPVGLKRGSEEQITSWDAVSWIQRFSFRFSLHQLVMNLILRSLMYFYGSIEASSSQIKYKFLTIAASKSWNENEVPVFFFSISREWPFITKVPFLLALHCALYRWICFIPFKLLSFKAKYSLHSLLKEFSSRLHLFEISFSSNQILSVRTNGLVDVHQLKSFKIKLNGKRSNSYRKLNASFAFRS